MSFNVNQKLKGLDSLDVNRSSTFGRRNEIPMPYYVVREGGKESSTDVDCWEVDLDSWWKARYPNKAGDALDDDGRENGIS